MVDYVALVTEIARSLVSNPDQVQVSSSKQEDGSTRIDIKVAEGDTGRVIGRRGTTINAIRTLIRVCAARNSESVSVEVAESDRPAAAPAAEAAAPGAPSADAQ